MARESTRKTRTPIGDMSRSRLRVDGKDSNYVYYIANDSGGRIDMMKEAGWEPVTDATVKIGDRRVAVPTDEGSVKTVQVGGGITGVLMRIPKEYWDEDQQRKIDQNKQIIGDTMKDAKSGSDYGDVKLS